MCLSVARNTLLARSLLRCTVPGSVNRNLHLTGPVSSPMKMPMNSKLDVQLPSAHSGLGKMAFLVNQAPLASAPNPAAVSRLGQVVEVEKLDSNLPNLLMSLSRGDIMAIRIPKWIDEDVAARASEGILNSPDSMPYWYTNNTVSRRGMTFSEVFGQAGVKNAEELAASAGSGKGEANTAYSGLDTYYNGSVSSMAGVRSHFAPFLSPIDKLRVECDELMPFGAYIEHLHPGRKMMCGIVRVIEPNAKVLVHQDRLDWDLQTLPHFGSPLLQQLTCNCYLTLPEKGGELKLWPFSLEKPDYMRLANGEYGIRDEAQFGPPLLLKPRVGELIIFNSQKLHAINQSSSKRIAVSSFIGFRGINQPLTFWS